MKKVINGSRYNTETAKKICFWDSTWDNSLDYVSETLYRTKAGKYFLHGEGGPRTKYAERTDHNSWSGGELIIPMTEADAREFAEQHMDADELEAVFDVAAEPTNVTIQLPDDLLAELDSKKGKLSRSEVAIKALKAYFAAEG